MKKKTVIVVIGLLLCFQVTNVLAQKFKPGYIITKDGKKNRGFVKISTEIQSALSCSFANNDKGEGSKVYSPKDLLGYGYNNDQMYESKLVKFFDVIKDKEVEQTLFLEVLAKGKANLYYFKDDKPFSRRKYWQPAQHYYIQKDGGEIPELKVKGKIVYTNWSRYISYTKLYVGTLNYTLTGCPSIKKELNKTKLARKSLKKLINAYNGCVDPNSQTIVEEKRQRYNWMGFSVNSFSSNLSFVGLPARNISGGKASGIGFGMFLMFGLDRNQLVFFETGLNFSKRSYDLTYVTNLSREYDLSISVMQMPLIFSFATPGDEFQAYASLGAGFNFALGVSQTLSERPSPVIDLDEDFNKSSLSLLLGAGIKGKFNQSTSWRLGMRWENNQEFLHGSNQGARAKILTFDFGLGFRL